MRQHKEVGLKNIIGKYSAAAAAAIMGGNAGYQYSAGNNNVAILSAVFSAVMVHLSAQQRDEDSLQQEQDKPSQTNE